MKIYAADEDLHNAAAIAALQALIAAGCSGVAREGAVEQAWLYADEFIRQRRERNDRGEH